MDSITLFKAIGKLCVFFLRHVDENVLVMDVLPPKSWKNVPFWVKKYWKNVPKWTDFDWKKRQNFL